jgi:uncharacterized protein
MRYLIDGYNVMHAGGRMPPLRKGSGKRPGDLFRKLRLRFLDELAETLPAGELGLTTIVFDAVEPPAHLPSNFVHKAITVVFAVAKASADEHIEELLETEKNAKSLTVVSSDNRIRIAAARKGAQVLSADGYWTKLDELKERRQRRSHPVRAREPETTPEEQARERGLQAADADYWHEVFADVDRDEETRIELLGSTPMISEQDLARIRREVEENPF